MKMAELYVVHALLKMVLSIQVSGPQVLEMAMGHKCGQMVLDTKEVGNMTRRMEWAS